MNEIRVDSIYEVTEYVDAPIGMKWLPNMSLLMHVARHETFGEDDVQDIKDGGGNPRKAKIKVMVHVEYLD